MVATGKRMCTVFYASTMLDLDLTPCVHLPLLQPPPGLCNQSNSPVEQSLCSAAVEQSLCSSTSAAAPSWLVQPVELSPPRYTMSAVQGMDLLTWCHWRNNEPALVTFEALIAKVWTCLPGANDKPALVILKH